MPLLLQGIEVSQASEIQRVEPRLSLAAGQGGGPCSLACAAFDAPGAPFCTPADLREIAATESPEDFTTSWGTASGRSSVADRSQAQGCKLAGSRRPRWLLLYHSWGL